MKIEIRCVGKLKKGSPEEALIQRYQTRLLSAVEIVELSEKLSDSEIDAKLTAHKAGQRSFFIALDGRGKQITSEVLSKQIEQLMVEGYGGCIFLIGGFKGLSREVVACCDLVIAMGGVTWPHQLMRAMLMEQIYRSFQMIKGAPYHY